MAHGFKRVDRDQAFLLPPDLRDWLPEQHLARFVVSVVDELDLTEVRAGFRLGGRGRQAYDPAMLTALLLYGYAIGVRSSRRLERACVEDIACRFIAANQHPDHVTIARFRSRHAEALAGLFTQVLALAVQSGLVDPTVVAIDSTKIAAAASMEANLSAGSLEQLARDILDEAAAVDAAEDDRYGRDRRGDEPRPGWEPGPGQKDRIRRALEELAARDDNPRQAEIDQEQAERVASGQKRRGRPRLPADPTKRGRIATQQASRKVNLTDPESRAMRAPGRYLQGYTAQAVAVPTQIVIAVDVTNQQNDNPSLHPMITQANGQLHHVGADPIGTVLADRGYWNSAAIDQLENNGTRCLVAPAGDRHVRAGQLPDPGGGSDLQPMAHRFTDPDTAALYRRRSVIIEPIFGQLKINRRLDRFLRRGLDAARHEWALIATAHNLTKLHTAPAT